MAMKKLKQRNFYKINVSIICFSILNNFSVPDFGEKNKRAIDEVWYKRAVEQHFVENQSFIFSVPFDAGNNSKTLVTASHAIFHHSEDKKSMHSAPVAVVGFQFLHTNLFTIFKTITSNVSILYKRKPFFFYFI